jgi:undecaprenyl-diphosphatase
MDFGFDFSGTELVILLVGMAVSFGISLLVIGFLLDYVRKHDFRAFGYYRIALGAVVLAVFGSGIIG